MFDGEVAVVKPHGVEFESVAVFVAVDFAVTIIGGVGENKHIFMEAFCAALIVTNDDLIMSAKEDSFYDDRIALTKVFDNEIAKILHSAKAKTFDIFGVVDAGF